VLEGAGRRMRVGYTSPSLVGLNAALRAGLGHTVLPLETVPTDLAILPKGLLPRWTIWRLGSSSRPAACPDAGETFAQALLGALKADRRARTRAN
jgi:DNA-binding transcriptional LysR family regulator